MDTHDIYYKMFESLKKGGIISALQAAYEVLNMPISIADASFNMLAKNYPPTPQDDECWDIPLKEQKVPLEIVQIFQRHNIIDIVQKSPHKSIYLNWGWFQKHPRLTTTIIANNNIVGYVAVLCPIEKYQLWQEDALQIVADTIGIILQKEQILNENSNVIVQSFARDLIMGTIQNQKDLQKWMDLSGIKLKGGYTILAITPTSEDNLVSITYLQKQLFYEPSLLMYPMDHILYILLYNQNRRDSSKRVLLKIYEIIEKLGSVCGISNTFFNLEDILLYREQALIALQVGRKLNPENLTYVYNNYTLSAILMCSFDKIQPKNRIHPAIFVLQEYDKANHTEYLETLKAYITNQQSTTIVSNKMHIHRNTLMYRLKKAEKITNTPIHDNLVNTHLLVSFQILELEEKLKHFS